MLGLHLSEARKLKLVMRDGGRHGLVVVRHAGGSVLLVVLLVELCVDVGKRRLVLAILELRGGELVRVPVALHGVGAESLLEHLWALLLTIVSEVDLSRHVVVLLSRSVATWNTESVVVKARSLLVAERRKVDWGVDRVWRAGAAGRRV